VFNKIQFSSVSVQYFRLRFINLAAVLSTDWSRSSMYVGIPAKVAPP